jgi:hypothetical protein
VWRKSSAALVLCLLLSVLAPHRVSAQSQLQGDVCASSPCQNNGQCTQVTGPAAGGGGGGHRRRHLQSGVVCSLAAVGTRTALINQQCCGADDGTCSGKGVPSSCDAGCAQVFLPFWQSCGSLFDNATYAPVVALCQAADPAQQHPCDMSTIASQSAAINRECCGAGDAACAGGVPASCDTGCAAVFLPFWASCGSVFPGAASYTPVVTMCHSPTPIMAVSFTCSCVANWQGDLCETPRDPCDGWSCGTYGTCHNGVCSCPPGASGAHCEHDPCRHIAVQMLVDQRSGTVYPCVHGTCQGGACACEGHWGGSICARWASTTVSPPAECDFTFPCAVRYPELPPPPPPPRGPMQCCHTCNCNHYCSVYPSPGCGADVRSPTPLSLYAPDVCGQYCMCTPVVNAPYTQSWGCVADTAPQCQAGGALHVC